MKSKKCKICKETYQPTQPLQQVCGAKCATQYVNNRKQKAWSKEKTERRDKLKTHSDWSNELQIEINTIVRLIDKGTFCISGLRPLNDKYDAGHRYSCGAFPSIRFHLLNIHAQSVHENQYKSGNPDGYDKGLREIYGSEYLSEVHGLKEKYPVLKLTIPELIEAKARAKKIVKSLKELNLTYSPKMRIELRKKYNKKLGIYD